MNIEGIRTAKARTHHDLVNGRRWSPEHLSEPHLPHTIKHLTKATHTDLETPYLKAHT